MAISQIGAIIEQVRRAALVTDGTSRTPAALTVPTIKAAAAIAAGQTAATGIISSHVALLTEGVLKAMMLTKLKTATASLFLLGVIAFGGAMLARHTAAAQQNDGADKKPAADATQDALRWEVVPGTKKIAFSVAFQDAKTEQGPNRITDPTKSLDETKLHGEWTCKHEVLGSFILIFGPGRTIRRIKEDGHDDTGTYSVDWSKKPYHLDLKLMPNQPLTQTIMEFLEREILRIEIGGSWEEPRPKAFTSETIVLTKRKAPPPGSKEAQAAAAKDLTTAEFYLKTSHFSSAHFYGEMVKRRYPGTEFAKKATQLLAEVNKHRIRRPDGSEGWAGAEPQAPPPAPAVAQLRQATIAGPRTVVLENARLVIDESARMNLTPVKMAKGPRVRLEIAGKLSTITVEAPTIRIESRDNTTEVAATETGDLITQSFPAPKAKARRVGNIIVVGNTKTTTAAILKKLGINPGQLLDDRTLRSAEKNLSAFNAAVTVETTGDGSIVDIMVRLKE